MVRGPPYKRFCTPENPRTFVNSIAELMKKYERDVGHIIERNEHVRSSATNGHGAGEGQQSGVILKGPGRSPSPGFDSTIVKLPPMNVGNSCRFVPGTKRRMVPDSASACISQSTVSSRRDFIIVFDIVIGDPLEGYRTYDRGGRQQNNGLDPVCELRRPFYRVNEETWTSTYKIGTAACPS